MNKSIGYIVGITIVIGVGAILQYFLCCGPGLAADNGDVLTLSGARTGMSFSLTDPTGNFSVSTPQNFDFPSSSYSYIKPIDPNLEEAIGKLQAYLSDNDEVTVGIKGFSFSGEENLSAFPTLGEARANAVKSAFIDRGISGIQLSVSGEKMEERLSSNDSVVIGPITYSMMHPDKSTSTGSAQEIGPDNDSEIPDGIVADLESNPMVLHFETGSAYVSLTADERQLISRLNQYIDQNDRARIIITGHTDNSGNPETNQRLGMERAEFLKSYLVRNGFQSDRINTVSHGQSDPIASNNTTEGRAENRRAVMTLEN